MYSLIIVDDETVTHELLRDYIENVIGHFKVVGCFKNGKEAIDFLEKNHTDIVITDIKMPKISGLEVAKYIYENSPTTKVIIVSAYGEFEYAKQAIEYNVSNYLLKAIDMNELTETLRKIEDELSEKKKAIFDSDYTTQREGFFTDLIVGALETDKIEAEYKKCGISYPINKAQIALFKCQFLNYDERLYKKWNYDAEYFNDAIKGILQSVVNEYNDGVVIEINRNADYIIIAVITDFAISDLEKKFEENLCSIVDLECKITRITDFCGIYDMEKNNNVFNKSELYKIMLSYIKMYGTEKAKKVINNVMRLINNEDPDGRKLSIIDNNGNVKDEEVYNVIGAKSGRGEIVEKAKEYINNNYMKDISYSNVADELFFNAVYFSRYFKQETGSTLGEYILEVRMKNAIEYLKTNAKIGDIAQLCGYRNTRTFQRVFKNYTGYSAADYKKYVLKNI